MNPNKADRRASYLARFGYEGHRFHGLQPNPGVITAGGTLLNILEVAAGTRPKALQFSARTDAGVHAAENYATFWFKMPFDHDSFMNNLNKTNLAGLTFLEVNQVPYKIHARANAHGKWYRYLICDGSPIPLQDSHTSWVIFPHLDIDAMRSGASFLVGTHRFDAFRHGGCSSNSTSKTIESIHFDEVFSTLGRTIVIDIRGTGFLRRMVRIIVGTLAEIGAGLKSPKEMNDILFSLDRRKAGPSAPACGLTLMHIDFRLD